MIFLQNKAYAVLDLQKTARLKCAHSESLTTWERDFWIFVQEWFSDTEYIEVKTSGSTGKPKIIRHLKTYCVASAKATCQYFGLAKGNRALLCLPITSIGGKMMFVRSLVADFDLYVQKPSSNPLENLESEMDFVAMVPMQVQQSIKQSIAKWSFVKILIIGGGKVNFSLKQAILKQNINAYSTFGMTETISHIALAKITAQKDVYEAMAGVHFSQNDFNCLKIQAAHLGIEVLQTNDIVELLSEKEFMWLGRKDNAIESGGYKFLPELLEQKISHLVKVPYFISSLPCKVLNQKIVLLVESKEPIIAVDDLKSVFTKYECPKQIFFLPKFDYLHSGKIDKKASLAQITDLSSKDK